MKVNAFQFHVSTILPFRADQPLQATILSLHGASINDNPSPYLCSRRLKGELELTLSIDDKIAVGIITQYKQLFQLVDLFID